MIRFLKNGDRAIWVGYDEDTGHTVGQIVSTVKGFTVFASYRQPVTAPTLEGAKAILRDLPVPRAPADR